MEKSQTFGQKLREYRESKRYSIRQVSMWAGISDAYWSQVETGKRSVPKPKTLEKMAGGLRVNKSLLFEWAGLVEHGGNSIPLRFNAQKLSIPIYGRISAGYPQGANEDIEGSIDVDHDLVDRYGINNLLAVRVDGDSMNKLVPNGSIAILAKVDPSEISNGDVCGVIIDGEAATLKHVYQYPDRIRFEPDTWLPDLYKPFEFKKDDVENDNPPIQIIGKLVRSVAVF